MFFTIYRVNILIMINNFSIYFWQNKLIISKSLSLSININYFVVPKITIKLLIIINIFILYTAHKTIMGEIEIIKEIIIE